MYKLCSSLLAGIVLIGISVAFVPSAYAHTQVDPSSSASAKLAAENANCYSNCLKVYRQGNVLKLVALDGNGQIFTIRRIHLPSNAKLVSVNHSAKHNNPLGFAQTNSTIVTSNSITQTYITLNGGVVTIVVVTTTFVYVNGKLVAVEVSVRKITLNRK